jgi:signal transduction histidine kinase
MNKNRTDITSLVAHELKAPLRSISLHADLLGEAMAKGTPAERLSLLAAVKADVATAHALIDSLLVIRNRTARIADWPGLMDAVVAAANAPPGAIRVAPGPTGQVADALRLHFVLGSIVSNSLRHGKPPVDISYDGTTFVLSDHGLGFPDMFTFERLEATRGMALVRRVIAARGGVMKLGRTASGGARVEFTWPAPKPLLEVPA